MLGDDPVDLPPDGGNHHQWRNACCASIWTGGLSSDDVGG